MKYIIVSIILIMILSISCKKQKVPNPPEVSEILKENVNYHKSVFIYHFLHA